MKKLVALLVSAVLMLATGCSKAPQKLTMKDLEAEKQQYIEYAKSGLEELEKMDWYTDDLTLVAVTPGYEISSDRLRSAQTEEDYMDTHYSGKAIRIGRAEMEGFFVDSNGNYYSCQIVRDGDVFVKTAFNKPGDLLRRSTYFFSFELSDTSKERIDMLRQDGDYIQQYGSDDHDGIFFFIDASEILG